MRVSIRQVRKLFGADAVLRDISLDVAPGELFFLLGPSGCGKTTLLRLLAGFLEPDAGEIVIGDRSMRGVPPNRRNIGMVFQNYALWPHLTVTQNVAYGLEVRKVPVTERNRRVDEALAIVRMTDHAARKPNQLSGGQQQRVALARALVVRPDLLLLDEPLSNLDARLRLELRDEIRRIHAQTRITTLYVTHDQQESLSMADRMAVMRAGRIEQVGTPRAIYRTPASRFVAEFIGEMNWLPGRVIGSDAGRLSVETAFGCFQVVSTAPVEAGAPVTLGFRPEAAVVGEAAGNALSGRIGEFTYLGEVEQFQLELEGGLSVKICEQNPTQVRVRGERLTIKIRPEDLLLVALPAGD